MWKYVIWLIFLQQCGSDNVDYSDYHPKNIPLQDTFNLQYQNPSPDYRTFMSSLYDNWGSPITYLQKRGYIPAKEQEDVKIDIQPQEEHNSIDDQGDKSEILLRGKNYFFFPEKSEEDLQNNAIMLEEDDKEQSMSNAGVDIEIPDMSRSIESSSNETTSIMSKVRDKFLSIFAHNGNEVEAKSDNKFLDVGEEIFDPEFQDYLNDYDSLDRRIFTRSATEKPPPNKSLSEIFENLSQTDIEFIKIFIDCFKQNKKDFVLQPASNTTTAKNTTTDGKGETKDSTTESSQVSKPPSEAKSGDSASTKTAETKPSDAKSSEAKPQDGGKANDTTTPSPPPAETKPPETKTEAPKPSEAKAGDKKPTETKPTTTTKPSEVKSTTTKPAVAKPSEAKDSSKPPTSTVCPVASPLPPECVPITLTPPTATTPVCIPVNQVNITTKAATSTGTGSSTNPPASKTGPSTGTKGISDDFTIDLDINQKNGTGQDVLFDQRCTCIPITSTTLAPSAPPPNTKYITISKFLAHLHHQVDEVGKPPYKPLDLKMVEEVIQNCSSTVVMGDGNTNEHAPLRLNDMSFDLEWNKLDKAPDIERPKSDSVDFTFPNQPDGMSLATKFLQEAKAYSQAASRHLDAPYGDNFLDTQSQLRSQSDVNDQPYRPSTKREAAYPYSASHSRKLSNLLSDIASVPSPEADDDYDTIADDSGSSLRRRIKGRMRVGGRKSKKGRFRPNPLKKVESERSDVLDELNDDEKESNDFDSFDELKDIQFRVSDEDEEAISKFISNLNAPPEIFNFDVDKYLRSVETKIEPEGLEYEFKSPEPRTYYEFMQTPAIEKERLPIIEAPSDIEFRESFAKKGVGHDRVGTEKRDLLRQYIKGVSSALSRNIPESTLENSHIVEDKSQRSPNLDNDINFRTSNLVAGFSTNLDAMNYIKSNDNDDFLDNYYLLNDGSSEIYETPHKNLEILPSDKFSPQSLEIDLDLSKKFRDLGIGYLASANEQDDESNDDDTVNVNRRKIEAAEVENDQY